MNKNIKVAKELIKLAKSLVAKDVEVDQTEHSIDQIWTWIFQNAHETFEKFLNEAKLKAQDFRYNEGYSVYNLYDFKKDKFDIQIVMSAKKDVDVPQTKEIKIRNFTCFGGQAVEIKGELKTNEWLPLWRSCKDVTYDEETGDLDNDSIKKIEDSMEKVLKQFFG